MFVGELRAYVRVEFSSLLPSTRASCQMTKRSFLAGSPRRPSNGLDSLASLETDYRRARQSVNRGMASTVGLRRSGTLDTSQFFTRPSL